MMYDIIKLFYKLYKLFPFKRQAIIIFSVSVLRCGQLPTRALPIDMIRNDMKTYYMSMRVESTEI